MQAETNESLIDLRDVSSSAEEPKGFAPYAPRGRTIDTVERIVALYEEMEQADALPLGPRQVGYRLKELYGADTYDKEPRPGSGGTSFETIGDVLKRLAQANAIPFEWIADGSAAHYPPGGYDDPADYLDNLPEYERDLRQRQAIVVEIYTEARETLPLISRIAGERGVHVYSGSGSSGPNLARKTALRAVQRAVQHGQSTVLLGICDFDLAGIRNILRPHVEHLAAFLYGSPRSDYLVAYDDQTMPSTGLPAVEFRQFLLTPEDALQLADTDDERDRVQAYLDSGDDLWSRDLKLLDGLRKIETEALDPRELRRRVIEAIESVLDLDTLDAVRKQADDERETLASSLNELPLRFA
jgi:hypothetical protein